MQYNHLAKMAAIGMAVTSFGSLGVVLVAFFGIEARSDPAPAERNPSHRADSKPQRDEDRAGNHAAISRWQNTNERSSHVRALEELKGTPILGREGEALGEVQDLLVASHSGELAGMVVSSGGFLGFGSKLRVVPGHQLRPTGQGGDLRVAISKREFQALSVATEADLERGAVAVLPFEAGSGASTRDGATQSAKAPEIFVAASSLQGRDVRAGDRKAGEIDDIAIDLEQRRAMAIVNADEGFGEVDGKFVVPFSRLDVASNRSDAINATLGRSDFAVPPARTTRAKSDPGDIDRIAGRTYAGRDEPAVDATSERAFGYPHAPDNGARSLSSRAAPPVDFGVDRDAEKLTPEGEGIGLPAQENAELARAALRIESALAADTTLAPADVRARAEGNKVVLKGSVKSEDTKKRITQLARDTATAVEIENQITVREP